MSGIGEIVGIVSSVAALVELSGKILQKGYSYTSTVVKAPVQIRQLLSEVSALDTLLNEIGDLANDTTGSSESALRKIATDKRLEECEILLVDILKVVSKCEKQEGHTLSNLKRQAQWPLEKNETTRLVETLRRLRSYFDSAIMIDTARKVDSTAKGVQALQDTEQYNSLVSWICPADTDVDTNLHDAKLARYPGTCQWLLDGSKYIEWKRESHNKILWINGPPGCGKTVMSAVVIENLKETLPNSRHAVLYFYLEHRDSSKQSLAAILGQALRQLFHIKPECIKCVAPLRDSSDKTMPPTAKLKMDLLKDITRTFFDRVSLVIDALDEAASTEEVLHIIESLSYLTQSNEPDKSPAAISVSCTSRRLPYIEQKFGQIGCHDLNVGTTNSSEIHQDIRAYIVGRLEKRFSSTSLPRSGNQATTTDLKEQAIKIVGAKSGGLFLQARYHLDLLSDTRNIKTFRAVLDSLPNGLTDTYNLILRQIRQNHAKYMTEILRMLHWIAGAKEPTTVTMLSHVAVIEPDDTDFDPEVLWHSDELILMLSGLVTVDRDHGSSLVKFSHYTIREHLSSPDILDSTEAVFFIDFQAVNKELARVALQYLSFEQFAKPDPAYASPCDVNLPYWARGTISLMYIQAQDLSRCRWMVKKLVGRSESELEKKLNDYPLLEYASEFWFDHVNDARITAQEFIELTPNLQTWLFDPEGKDPRFLNWAEIHGAGCIRSDFCERKQPPLYFALLFGVLPWIQVLATNPAIHSSIWTLPFSGGWTPILLAAASGSTSVVDAVLLHAGRDIIDTPASEKHMTALHAAAELGDYRMIEHLLKKGASPWVLTQSGTTPLYRAARSGSTRSLKLIYESVEPDRRAEYLNIRTWDNWTTLIEAVVRRKTDMVEFLLDEGADWSVKTFEGADVMFIAKLYGPQDMRDLLDRKIGKTS